MSAASTAYMVPGGVFTLLGEPERAATGTALLFCPPFGWEAVAARRPLRDWALALTADGHVTLRIDLPGSGDSAGDSGDPGLWAAWRTAVADGARLLAARPGVDRVVAVGIGLGGLLAIEAITAADAPIDAAALWAVPVRGRTLLRELQAFARFEGAESPRGEDDGLTVAGHRLSGETMAAWAACDLRSPAAGALAGRDVLLLDSDGRRTDPALATALTAAGATVERAAAGVFSRLVAEPHDAELPAEAAAALASWLARPPRRRARPAAVSPTLADRLELPGGAHERPFETGGRFGILAVPPTAAGDICLLFLNAGAIDHSGPNRLWVTAARAWAARGVPSLRLDLEGIGESDGDASVYRDNAAFHRPELVAQVRAAVDRLADAGTGTRFIVIGLCSGAYWGFHTACEDERVASVVMINPRALIWDPGLDAARAARRAARMVRAFSWQKLRETGAGESLRLAPSLLGALGRRLVAAPHRRRAGTDDDLAAELERRLTLLRNRDTRLLALFTGDEPLHEELERAGLLDAETHRGLRVRMLGDAPAHTLRPPSLQRRALDEIDREIAAVAGCPDSG